MISRYSIQNFKAIGDAVEIELKPITLLFGPNSSGKSSLMQSLTLYDTLVSTKNPLTSTILQGGLALELGSREEYAHAGNVAAPTRWSAEWLSPALAAQDEEADDLDLPEVARFAAALELKRHDGEHTDVLEVELRDVVGVFLSVKLGPGRPGVAFRDHPISAAVLDEAYSTLNALGGEPVIPRPAIGKYVEYALNLLPDAFLVAGGRSVSWNELPVAPAMAILMANTLPEPARSVARALHTFAATMHLTIDQLDNLAFSAMSEEDRTGEDRDPTWAGFADWCTEKGLGDVLAQPTSWENELHAAQFPPLEVLGMLNSIRRWLAGLISGLRDDIAYAKYLGPLRTIPGRPGFTNVAHGGVEGLGEAAWLSLVNSDWQRNLVNHWLGPEGLDTGLEVAVRTLVDEADVVRYLTQRPSPSQQPHSLRERIPVAERHIRLQETRTGRPARVSAVGVGVAQVLPVVAQAVADFAPLTFIEQPELHLHPALQANLADVFIAAIRSPSGPMPGQTSLVPNGRRFLLETHSEHLMLRMLRRIRETTHGGDEVALKLLNDDVAVYYVHPDDSGAQVTRIHISPEGEFTTPWPRGFFPERLQEL